MVFKYMLILFSIFAFSCDKNNKIVLFNPKEGSISIEDTSYYISKFTFSNSKYNILYSAELLPEKGKTKVFLSSLSNYIQVSGNYKLVITDPSKKIDLFVSLESLSEKDWYNFEGEVCPRGTKMDTLILDKRPFP